ncbi:MAG: ATP-binding protein [Candidatus Eisenbacteria bacterium]|nr:ATP-binding protein [Candidatus Eisenbacteria bacterium]
MIQRRLERILQERLSENAAVVLLGPRQVGKTTIASALAERLGGLYLDLESPSDQARLAEPELYLRDHLDRLVVLDEIHRAPGLLPVLRGLIDRARRSGAGTGMYLLLGSASLDLLQQAGETLAGRVGLLELHPLDVTELGADAAEQDRLWVRGGFPLSVLAPDDGRSARWRRDFIRTYLERDIPQFGPRIAAETLRRFWGMLAHQQGGLLNVAQMARNLGIDGRTCGAYVDLLCDLLLVRRLPAWHANVGKRLVKSPKVYVRDSGLLHALLGLEDKESILSHPVVGASWEGFAIEQILAVAPDGVQAHFYRTGGGAEVDLLMVFPDGRLWAIEIKRSLSPRPERGFHSACHDLAPTVRAVVYPGQVPYPITPEIEAIPLLEMVRRVAAGGQ